MRIRKTTVALVAAMLVLSLAGCSSSEGRGVTKDECSDTSQSFNNGFSTCVVTLNDTRHVTCVTWKQDNYGGVSCDWDHASGTDKADWGES